MSPETKEEMAKKKSKRRPRGTAPFGQILTALMEEKDMGVREAARVAGVGASTIVSWRGGALPEDYQAVKRLAATLGTTLSYLLTGEDETRPAGFAPAISEVFRDGGALFDGYAKITIQRLIPKDGKSDE
jgi:transcriptional regulator with XRE-family HTH domain